MCMEELIDSAQVDRQRIDLAVMRGIHAVHIVREARETIDVVPHTLIGRVEQVRAILVDLRAGLLIKVRVRVAADVVTDIDDAHARAGVLHRLLRHRQTEQARANDNEIGILNRICHAQAILPVISVQTQGSIRHYPTDETSHTKITSSNSMLDCHIFHSTQIYGSSTNSSTI